VFRRTKEDLFKKTPIVPFCRGGPSKKLAGEIGALGKRWLGGRGTSKAFQKKTGNSLLGKLHPGPRLLRGGQGGGKSLERLVDFVEGFCMGAWSRGNPRKRHYKVRPRTNGLHRTLWEVLQAKLDDGLPGASALITPLPSPRGGG